MNNIIVQVVAISCCIFTVYTVLKSAYLGFQRMKKGQPSKSVVEESGHARPLEEIKSLPNDDDAKYSKEDYKERFFKRLLLKHRAQTYIEKDFHDLIKRLVVLNAPGTTTSSYINLIVKEHLWRNRDVIKELLKDVKIKSL